jgi:hypothetical protein
MKRHHLLALLPILILACRIGASAATPTPLSASPSPDVSEPLPSEIAAVTPSEEGPIRPPEAILILEPGPNSQVTSPVRIAGMADPTFEQNLVVTVTDESGAVIALEPTTIQAPSPERGPFEIDLAFSVPADQPGRISVYDVSARDGGLIHLSSVEVTLLAGGSPVINPPPAAPETIAIFGPVHLAEIPGGGFTVSGFSEYFFESNLGVVVCGEGGSGAPDQLCGTADNVIASSIAIIAAPDIGLPGPFSGEIAYSISSPVQARIVVYAASPRDGDLLHASSRPVNLTP